MSPPPACNVSVCTPPVPSALLVVVFLDRRVSTQSISPAAPKQQKNNNKITQTSSQRKRKQVTDQRGWTSPIYMHKHVDTMADVHDLTPAPHKWTLALNQTSKQRQKRQIWLRDYIVHHILKQIFRWYICGLSKANQKITARFNIWSNQDKNVAIIISANERKLNVYKNKQTNNINSNSCITLEFF